MRSILVWWWMSFTFLCLWILYHTPIPTGILYIYICIPIIGSDKNIFSHGTRDTLNPLSQTNALCGRCFFLYFCPNFFFKHSYEHVEVHTLVLFHMCLILCAKTKLHNSRYVDGCTFYQFEATVNLFNAIFFIGTRYQRRKLLFLRYIFNLR